jgi:hypothetical protein
MVKIRIDGSRAVFEPQGWHQLWTLRSRLEIPLSHITDVRPSPGLMLGWVDRLRLAGTHLPFLFSAGTFLGGGGLDFWDVEDPDRAIIVELRDETYWRLVIEVKDPAGSVAMLKQAVDRAASAK